jgi:hypothetical protein
MNDNLKEVKRGEEAERLLENPVYQEAISTVRDGILTAMQNSALGDESTHHNLVIALQLVSQIEKSIKDVAATGKMAKIQASNGTFGAIRAAAGF